MAMTAKHYKLVAKVLKKSLTKSIIMEFVAEFSANDSKFNKDKFLKECGL